jgi:hypothetical protein
MNTNSDQSTQAAIAPQAAQSARMRWPFMLDFGLFCLSTAQVAITLLRQKSEGAAPDYTDSGSMLAYVALVARLAIVPISDIFGWNDRPEARKLLQLAAFVTGLQLALGVYGNIVWIVQIASEYDLAETFSNSLLFGAFMNLLSIVMRIAYNAVFYYWALAQARSSPGAR